MHKRVARKYYKCDKNIWCPRRIDISDYWHAQYPFDIGSWKARATALSEQSFISKFSDIFENGSWIIEEAFKLELGPSHNTSIGLHNAFCRIFRTASLEKKKELLQSQSGMFENYSVMKMYIAKKDEDIANTIGLEYAKKFGFKYTLSNTDAKNCDVLENLKERLQNDYATEFTNCCRQIEKIALEKLSKII